MSTVEEIVEAIKELSPEKRDEVRRQLSSLWPPTANELARLVGQNKQGLPIKRARPRRPPIRIKGKPISETLVEERS